MPSISAVIITYNAERRLAQCLASLQGIADETVVLDAYSTDQTQAICRQFAHVRLSTQLLRPTLNKKMMP
ncbi:MAG: glycosyltransferase [Sphingobacteriales bacterium]|nr:glycosyltransferase [Sphingobacteriales bacterium]